MATNVYAVILAGGSGTRFWPKSRQKSPKQLCKIGDPHSTMIEKTLDRLDGFVPPENRLIVTHEFQVQNTKKIVGNRCQGFIAEPEAKNTAAALTMAALELPEDAIMLSLHADHIIKNEPNFIESLKRSIVYAEKGYLTLIGITPTHAETGYGYLEKGEAILPVASGGFRVASFREKPELGTAQEYLASKNFFWNSGYFVWQTKTLLEEIETNLPETLAVLKNLFITYKKFSNIPQSILKESYAKISSISIDNAILEKSSRVAAIESDFGWFDIGSWSSLADCFPTNADGNYLSGDVLALDSKNCVLDTDGPFIATLGVENLIVAVSNGSVLVCPKDQAQNVKNIVDQLKKNNRHDLV